MVKILKNRNSKKKSLQIKNNMVAIENVFGHFYCKIFPYIFKKKTVRVKSTGHWPYSGHLQKTLRVTATEHWPYSGHFPYISFQPVFQSSPIEALKFFKVRFHMRSELKVRFTGNLVLFPMRSKYKRNQSYGRC